MPWLRKALPVVLALLFVVLFIPALFLSRVNATAGNPGFYADQLRRADVYNFVHREVLPVALERAGLGAVPSLAKPHLLTISQQVLPPDWLQAQTEQAIYGIVPYLVGDTQGFTITVPLKSRVEESARSVKETLRKEGVFPPIYDQMVGSLSDIVSASLKGSPLPVGSDQVGALVRTAFPADWTLRQVDNAIDEVIPYITGDKAQFTVRINIPERVPFLSAALTDVLRKPEAYEYMVREVIVRLVKQVIQNTALPTGMTLTDNEILTVVKQAAPLDWYQARVPDIVGQVFGYLSGTRPNLEIAISIADRRPAIADAMAKLADQKLETAWNSLPVCSPSQIVNWLLNPPANSLPPCRPLDMSYADIKRLTRIDFGTLLAVPIRAALPDGMKFTEAQLGGTGPSSPLVVARAVLSRDLTLTDVQLRSGLGANSAILDSLRRAVATGGNFTEKDLRGALGSSAQQVDSLRSTAGTVRRLTWLLWLGALLSLAAIGLLGGRRWPGRLIWASAVLGAAALAALIIFGPVLSAAQAGINQELARMASVPDPLQAMVAGKAAAIAQSSINSFVGGLRSQSVIWLVVGAALVVAGAVWHMRGRRA